MYKKNASTPEFVYGSIYRMDLDGGNPELYASGALWCGVGAGVVQRGATPRLGGLQHHSRATGDGRFRP